jgi:hypothetical protein
MHALWWGVPVKSRGGHASPKKGHIPGFPSEVEPKNRGEKVEKLQNAEKFT